MDAEGAGADHPAAGRHGGGSDTVSIVVGAAAGERRGGLPAGVDGQRGDELPHGLHLGVAQQHLAVAEQVDHVARGSAGGGDRKRKGLVGDLAAQIQRERSGGGEARGEDRRKVRGGYGDDLNLGAGGERPGTDADRDIVGVPHNRAGVADGADAAGLRDRDGEDRDAAAALVDARHPFRAGGNRREQPVGRDGPKGGIAQDVETARRGGGNIGDRSIAGDQKILLCLSCKDIRWCTFECDGEICQKKGSRT